MGPHSGPYTLGCRNVSSQSHPWIWRPGLGGVGGAQDQAAQAWFGTAKQLSKSQRDACPHWLPPGRRDAEGEQSKVSTFRASAIAHISHNRRRFSTGNAAEVGYIARWCLSNCGARQPANGPWTVSSPLASARANGWVSAARSSSRTTAACLWRAALPLLEDAN